MMLLFWHLPFSKSFQLTLVDRSTLSSAEKLVPKSGKQAESFRNYEASAHQDRVERTYSLMHQNQTVDFVKKKVQAVLQPERKENEKGQGLMS